MYTITLQLFIYYTAWNYENVFHYIFVNEEQHLQNHHDVHIRFLSQC